MQKQVASLAVLIGVLIGFWVPDLAIGTEVVEMVAGESLTAEYRIRATNTPNFFVIAGNGFQTDDIFLKKQETTPTPRSTSPLTLHFSGEQLNVKGEFINAVPVAEDMQEFAPLFQNSQTITVSITFDTDQPDINPDPNTGDYRIGALSVDIPELGLLASRSSNSMQISVFNNTPNPDDQFSASVSAVDSFSNKVGLPSPTSFSVLFFGDTSMLTSDLLPTSLPNWTFGNVNFNFTASDGTFRQVLMTFSPSLKKQETPGQDAVGWVGTYGGRLDGRQAQLTASMNAQATSNSLANDLILEDLDLHATFRGAAGINPIAVVLKNDGGNTDIDLFSSVSTLVSI